MFLYWFFIKSIRILCLNQEKINYYINMSEIPDKILRAKELIEQKKQELAEKIKRVISYIEKWRI